MTLPEQKKQALLKEFRQKFVVYSDKLGEYRLLYIPISQFESFLLEKVAEAKQETAMQIVHDINLPSPREKNLHSIVWGIMRGWGITPEQQTAFDNRKEIKAQVAQGKDELHTEHKPFDSEKFTRLAEEIREGEK